MRTRALSVLSGLLSLLAFASLPGCGGGGGDTYNPALVGGGKPAHAFSLTVTPASVTVTQGQTATYTVTLASVNGFHNSVMFSAAGLPAGASASFRPASVTPTTDGLPSTLTITTAAADAETPTPAGTWDVTLSVSGGGITRTGNVSLVVNRQPPSNGGLQGTIQ